MDKLPLLEVSALYFDKLVILDPIGASTCTISAKHVARDTVRRLEDASILQTVGLTDALVQDEKGQIITMEHKHFANLIDVLGYLLIGRLKAIVNLPNT